MKWYWIGIKRIKGFTNTTINMMRDFAAGLKSACSSLSPRSILRPWTFPGGRKPSTPSALERHTGIGRQPEHPHRTRARGPIQKQW
jgi:hypothetical protein